MSSRSARSPARWRRLLERPLPERDVPDYIEADHSKMTATFVRTPALGDVPYPVMMEPHLVIEFYAQN